MATVKRPEAVMPLEPPADLQTLARQQGVSPVTNLDDLLGTFWPENESDEEFMTALREWRREGR